MASAVEVSAFQARSFRMGGNKTIVYRLFVPKNYQPSKKYPLMLTLHGAGERGSDDSAQLLHDFNRMWAADSVQNLHPCFVLAPQCPVDSQWVNTPWAKGSYNLDAIAISDPMKSVVGILDSLEKEFSLDLDRIYLSGISMGGYGTWYLAMKFPGRFAAAVPVCGGADPKKAASIAKLPIWTFHAEDDGTVPVAGTREMVAALKAAGSAVIYTEYPKALGYNHLSWIPAGKTPELVPWVFKQARASVRLVQGAGGTVGDTPEHAPAGGKQPGKVDALGKSLPGSEPAVPSFRNPAP
ncbi:MAG: phospholipase/Carboxylesterase [Fibrobacteres bacterium]|nr:phospholipase/Carboxylesterase [Fibrobacterota bacterium]